MGHRLKHTNTHTHTFWNANTHSAILHQQKCQALVLCLWLKLHSAMGIKEGAATDEDFIFTSKKTLSNYQGLPLIYPSSYLYTNPNSTDRLQTGTDILFLDICFSSFCSGYVLTVGLARNTSTRRFPGPWSEAKQIPASSIRDNR